MKNFFKKEDKRKFIKIDSEWISDWSNENKQLIVK